MEKANAFASAFIAFPLLLPCGRFVSGPDIVNSFIDDKAKYFEKCADNPLEEEDTLALTKTWVDLNMKPTFDLCVDVIFQRFTTFYRNKIGDLQHNLPKDARVTDKVTGADLGPFWHGHKRYPRREDFDASNPLHVDFVFHGANILASVFGLKEKSRKDVEKICAGLKAPEYVFLTTLLIACPAPSICFSLFHFFVCL